MRDRRLRLKHEGKIEVPTVLCADITAHLDGLVAKGVYTSRQDAAAGELHRVLSSGADECPGCTLPHKTQTILGLNAKTDGA
jgi:hypothetical protein